MNPIYSIALSGEHPSKDVRSVITQGVGMIRSEYIMRIGGHHVSSDKGQNYLSDYVKSIAEIYGDSPVWYRLSDFELREIGTLDGHGQTIFHEENPIVGNRGARRAQSYPSGLYDELMAVLPVAQKHHNLNVFISYAGTAKELRWMQDQIKAVGWPNKIGCMIEIPSAVIDLPEIIKLDFARYTVGLNDLTSLLFGTSRKSPFDYKTHHVVDKVIRSIVSEVSKTDAELAMAGNYGPELIPHFFDLGIPEFVIHYSELSDHFPKRFTSLPELDLVSEIKKRTAQLLENQ